MYKSTKNINIEVDVEVWKKLKIISIKKDLTLQEVVCELLIASLNKKKVSVDEDGGE